MILINHIKVMEKNIIFELNSFTVQEWAIKIQSRTKHGYLYEGVSIPLNRNQANWSHGNKQFLAV
jgi:hypothetical protein